MLRSDLCTGCNPFGRVCAPVWACHRLQAPQERVSHGTAAPQGVSTPAQVAHRSLQQCLTCSSECTQECPCPTAAFTAGSPFEGIALVALTAQKCTLPSSSSLFFLLISLCISHPSSYCSSPCTSSAFVSPAHYSCHLFLKDL